ncbi:hypothetical protein V1L52_03095 [Treponema sp. HNW]
MLIFPRKGKPFLALNRTDFIRRGIKKELSEKFRFNGQPDAFEGLK